MLEAIKVEKEIARDPRVVLSDGVVEFVNRHVQFYGNPYQAPQNRLVLRDADGRVFINYLNHLWVDISEDALGLDADSLAKHKDNVIRNLEQYRVQPRVWAKYQWVANYHNYFCGLLKHLKNYNDDLLIDVRNFELKPSPFVTGSKP